MRHLLSFKIFENHKEITKVDLKIKESIDLESISGFIEVDQEDDKIFNDLDNRLKFGDYDIDISDINFILKACDKLELNNTHDIKTHGVGKIEKKVLLIYLTNNNMVNIINIRRIPNDYFYIFVKKHLGRSVSESRYFLCDDLGGVFSFLKYFKKRILF